MGYPKGQCRDCGGVPAPARSRCDDCAREHRLKTRRAYHRRRAAGLCTRCGEPCACTLCKRCAARTEARP